MPDAQILTIDGRRWQTPLTQQALRRVGSARLTKTHYRGTYHYEGVGGFEYYRSPSWLPVIALQQQQGRSWKTWMVDDPLHWHGMREAVADLPSGRVLVAGLGLGLMLHHMAADPRFTAITVVEWNPDVIALIEPTLPPDERRQIIEGDYYRLLESRPAVDGVLWDLAVGTPEQTMRDMLRARILTEMYLGRDVPLVRFGMRRQPR